jgi:hypothetical protein
MSVASTSRTLSRNLLKKRFSTSFTTIRQNVPAVSSAGSNATLTSSLTYTPAIGNHPFNILLGKRFLGTASYSTTLNTPRHLDNARIEKESSESAQESEPDSDPDEPPKKAGLRERLRFLSRRYGWWALAVYLLASLVDLSLVFAAIHMLGADHIRDLEDRCRKFIGVGKRELGDGETAVWPVPVGTGVSSDSDGNPTANNAEAALLAAKRMEHQEIAPVQSKKSSSSSSGGSGTLWTEAVLAYTIHKTLLLPFRVGVTAAITPSFVKYMVKLGWAKDNAAVQRAAYKAKMAREAAKAKTAASATNTSKATVTSAAPPPSAPSTSPSSSKLP